MYFVASTVGLDSRFSSLRYVLLMWCYCCYWLWKSTFLSVVWPWPHAVFSLVTSRRQSSLASHQAQNFRCFYDIITFHYTIALILLGSIMHNITKVLRETGWKCFSSIKPITVVQWWMLTMIYFSQTRKNVSQKSINNTAWAQQPESVGQSQYKIIIPPHFMPTWTNGERDISSGAAESDPS